MGVGAFVNLPARGRCWFLRSWSFFSCWLAPRPVVDLGLCSFRSIFYIDPVALVSASVSSVTQRLSCVMCGFPRAVWSRDVPSVAHAVCDNPSVLSCGGFCGFGLHGFVLPLVTRFRRVRSRGISLFSAPTLTHGRIGATKIVKKIVYDLASEKARIS